MPDNAWLGVSVENRKHGIPRINSLQKINAKTRFLSIEPLIEDIGDLNLKGIAWVIVGGESGHKARPMKPEWAISIRDQCTKFKTKFFFKQWGMWGADGVKRNKKANGRKLDGEFYNDIPIQFLKD